MVGGKGRGRGRRGEGMGGMSGERVKDFGGMGWNGIDGNR